MMKLLNTDGAWLAIGISVFFLVVGLLMKRVFVNVLKNSAQLPEVTSSPAEMKQHD